MKQNTEGNVYPVNWKKTASGYSAWLKRAPKLKVHGKDPEELSDLLFDITVDRFGDGEPCFDFDPPFPTESAKQAYFEPEWFELNSNESFWPVGDTSALYSEGLCSYCGGGKGQRTSTPRVLDSLPKSDFAFITRVLPRVYIVSEPFLKFFRPLLGAKLRAIPCTYAPKSKKKFYELDLTPGLLLEAHKLAIQTLGIVCPTCKQQNGGSIICPEIRKGVFCAVERAKLMSLNSEAIIVSRGMSHHICINAQVAQRLKKSGGLKGVLLNRLVMLDANDIGKFKFARASKIKRPKTAT